MASTTAGDPVAGWVRRVLARDNLLQLAREAERAVGIVHHSEGKGSNVHSVPDLFAVALERHLVGAREAAKWATRSQHLSYAAAILQFCRLLGVEPRRTGQPWPEPAELYARAVAEVSARAADPVAGRDLTLGVLQTHRRIRGLRLDGRLTEAAESAFRPAEYFFGSGAAQYRAQFAFELAASLVEAGQAADADRALRESDGFWAAGEAAEWVTGNRYFFARALITRQLAARERGTDPDTAALVRLARERLTRHLIDEEAQSVDELSLTLALAELLAEDDGDHVEAVRLAGQALSIVERIRARWRVIVRSRTPLAVAFRRVYGDIALLAARLPGAASAGLGLSVALSAKQTGFASLLRAGRFHLNPHLRGLIDDIVDREDKLTRSDTPSRIHAAATTELRRLRGQLEDAVSPLLADTVLPETPAPARVVALVAGRYALDYVALPDTLTGEVSWFRMLIEPDGALTFDRFTAGEHFTAFFVGRAGEPAWLGQLRHATEWDRPDWWGLAREILPPALRDRLAADRDPVELVISPHSHLSALPWPALGLDGGARLVERAVVTQVPVLTCLSGERLPAATGPALVRLVGRGEGRGVDIVPERDAWGLRPDGPDRVPLSRCGFGPAGPVDAVDGDLPSALARPADWRFVHIAAHGDGDGLGQYVELPQRLTAGRALGLHWPPAALMASCHVGRLANIAEAEPFGFVMALLTSGCRCVVAGIDRVPDASTGRVAADIVARVRDGGVPLDVALARAQVNALRRGESEYEWALLNAFAR